MAESGMQVQMDDEKALRRLIGQRIRYLAKNYVVTDILFVEDLLILSADNEMDVQEDSYGRPNRMVPHQENLRFRDTDKKRTPMWAHLIFLDVPISNEP